MKTFDFSKKDLMKFIQRREVASIFLLILFLAAVLFSIFGSPHLYLSRMHEGDIALKDIYAPYDFGYKFGIDEEKTALIRSRTIRKIPYYLNVNTFSEELSISKLEMFFDIIESFEGSGEQDPDMSFETRMEKLESDLEITLSGRELKLFIGDGDKNKLKTSMVQIAKNIHGMGYISDENLDILKKDKVESVLIVNNGSKIELEKSIEVLVTPAGLKTTLTENTQWYFGDGPGVKKGVINLLMQFLRPNLELEADKTLATRTKAGEEIQPVKISRAVKKNEKIIEKGERINSSHVAQLSRIEDMFREEKSRKFFIGILLLLLNLGIFCWIYLAMSKVHGFLGNTRAISIILINLLFMILVSNAILRLPQPSYFIPLASMGMVLTLIMGFNLAFLFIIVMGVFISVLAGGEIMLAFVLIFGSIVGMFSVRDARKRSNILVAGVLAGVAKAIAIISLALVNGIEHNVFANDALWGILSGVFSALIVMGLLPLFEVLFKVSTNISLLEMSDLNHPLLKRLAMEAPGTYHHSIVVGNLAESACDRIGANSLLARVGAYYHDVGKISKPQYFTENELGGKSRHTGLTPSMSALIISNHVKEGVELARKANINHAIVDFIKQHHGDSLISFFYQKAIEKAKEESPPDDKNFRYPGPRPQTKETAIVLLADAVEAASRSLSDPTPSSIRNLVKKVINGKFIGGQLDECDLTLNDITYISEAFVRALMGIFHSRTSYPEESSETNGKAGRSGNGKNKLRKQE